jgi:5-methylcytosine-specific restriction protein B
MALMEEPPPIPAKRYTLEDFCGDTGFDRATIRGWCRRLRRKRHVIFQGPPGTGKTYVAERLARLMVSETNGVCEVVQFHPSYAYEDFIQGIRPRVEGGVMTFDLEEGRFLRFCRAALLREEQGSPCVLIIDEINRAHLARVFGELMYLLEYRDKDIPLAAGGARFRIPYNVYIIGTMNTADRSIALVDHALRRRFSFIRLKPDYDVLQRHLSERGLPADSLISVLEGVNRMIDDQNYLVGISFFMREDDHLPEYLPDVWQGEIEPYLEEFFYDQSSKVDPFRWQKLRQDELQEWADLASDEV